jgi:hypothetical protein
VDGEGKRVLPFERNHLRLQLPIAAIKADRPILSLAGPGPQFVGTAQVYWVGGLRGPIQFLPSAYAGAGVRFSAILRPRFAPIDQLLAWRANAK